MLKSLGKQVSQNTVSEQVMLDGALGTRRNVVVGSAIAVLAAIFLTLIITNAISNPVRKTLNLAEAVSQGDLTQAIAFRLR